ncbi:PREDICTED: subtilisin-like protease SBT1.9 [Nelumbo nucifera]|uniref:Subtilisin-like protease SBT1.9 n=1 Tax=Nelumbo nucifera TaxID=4432 RepID=A0A1U8AI57_NELNU|nr:PREDICTED: subtilisin-like protease SBT1.9 [Nelumbo nucifera]
MATVKPFCLWWILLMAISYITSLVAKPDVYIVHMDLSAMPTPFRDHHSWYEATLSSIKDGMAGVATTTKASNLIYTYSSAIHGFAARLSPLELELLEQSPGFVSSTRDVPLKAHTTRTPDFLGLNPSFGAWPVSNYGEDVIIGLVDSGIWPESASFGDDGLAEVPKRWKGECVSGTNFSSTLCNRKLIGARFYSKGIMAYRPDIDFSMNSARDTEGHGTHTSSIAAGNYVKGASYFGYANGTARGMAPKARVAMYKALWGGSYVASDVIAAIDQAIVDAVDVLSLSLGNTASDFYNEPIAIASFAAMEKGIFVAASAGNDGPYVFTVHNDAPWLLTVASGSLDRELFGVVALGNGVSIAGASLSHGSSSLTRLPLVYMGDCSDTQELNKVGHKIIVCKGTAGYDDKFTPDDDIAQQIYNVRGAGVAGGIFLLYEGNNLDPYLQFSFPAVLMNYQQGEAILKYINGSHDPRATLKFPNMRIGTKPAPRVPIYSSRGPSAICPHVLKPDLIAPGSFVLGSWVPTSPVVDEGSRRLYNNFNIVYGTSMACAHAAGVAALLRAAHPEWSPAAIRSAMMTTADSLDNTLKPITELVDNEGPASPLAMGAGQLNPNKALDPGLVYDANAEDYVRLLCALNYTKKEIKKITRSSSKADCSNPLLDLNYPSFIAILHEDSSILPLNTKVVKEFSRTVTNVGEGMATYVAKLAPIDGFKLKVKPDRLVFKEKYQKLSFKLTLKGPRVVENGDVHGYLSWEEVGGKHVVRSPIVATSFLNDD